MYKIVSEARFNIDSSDGLRLSSDSRLVICNISEFELRFLTRHSGNPYIHHLKELGMIKGVYTLPITDNP